MPSIRQRHGAAYTAFKHARRLEAIARNNGRHAAAEKYRRRAEAKLKLFNRLEEQLKNHEDRKAARAERRASRHTGGRRKKSRGFWGWFFGT